MRWFARPENEPLELRVAPRLASWNKAGDPEQVRLRAYLDDTEILLAESRVDGPWALRLDVGLPEGRDLLDMADLDNFAYPLASRLKDPGLVSVWCTKQHGAQSFVRIERAEEVFPPSTGWLIATTTASASTVAFKEQINATVAGAAELPPGAVTLELSFVVGTRRTWLNLWKQTIDSLDPLLGRTYPDRSWNPRDGRITELGMHVTVEPALGDKVLVGIAAAQPVQATQPVQYIDMSSRVLINQPGTRDHCRVATVVGLGPGESVLLEIGVLCFGMSISQLRVIDRRIPEGAVITHLDGHHGPCRDTEGTPGRCDVVIARGYETPDQHASRNFRCGQSCKPRPADRQLVTVEQKPQADSPPAASTEATLQASDTISEVQSTLRAAARDNGWEVLVYNGMHPSDTYLLPDESKRIEVIWASGGVLMASGNRHSKDGWIWRYGEDASTKAGLVLSALRSRTDEFPPAPYNGAARVHNLALCDRCFMVHDGECSPATFSAEIEQILIDHPQTRYAKVLLGMRRGLTNGQMAQESIEAGEPINAESVAHVRKLVRLSLDDELVAAPSDAAAQAGLYRELLNYRRSPELTQHINTKLAKLQALDPKIPLTPLGHVHLGANDPSKPVKPKIVCPHCFTEHAGECL